MRWKRWLYGFTVDGGVFKAHPVWTDIKLSRKGLFLQPIGVRPRATVEASRQQEKSEHVNTQTHKAQHVYTVSSRRMVRMCEWEQEKIGGDFPACLAQSSTPERELYKRTQPTNAEAADLLAAAKMLEKKYDLKEGDLTPRIILQIAETEGSRTLLSEQYSAAEEGLVVDFVVV